MQYASQSFYLLIYFINKLDTLYLEGLVKLVVTSYRLREMSCGFGETGEPHVEDDFLGSPSSLLLPPPPSSSSQVNKSPASATLRERDSMNQVRIDLDQIPGVIQASLIMNNQFMN